MSDIIEKIKQLKRAHYECDDPWFSCRAVPEHGFRIGECSCGADKYNAIVDEVISEVNEFFNKYTDAQAEIKRLKAEINRLEMEIEFDNFDKLRKE